MLPLSLLTHLTPDGQWAALSGSLAGLLALLAAEIIERVTFFSALSAPRMPGGLR